MKKLWWLSSALVLFGCMLLPFTARAQDEAAIPDTSKVVLKDPVEDYRNNIAGEFTPAKGFDIFKANRGSLNVSVYGVFRYLDQMPGEQTYQDHLGRTRTVKARRDINWHRSFVWVSGFAFDPRLRYTLTIWSLPTTQQTLVFGILRYSFSKPFTLGVGIGPNLTCRSMQGSWPFWAASDRQMAEDGLRGGFSSTVFATGQPIDKFFYTVSLTNNLSQLGVTATNDTRDMGYGGSVWWMPTTGEFGPRGGFGDLEEHQQVATRFGISAAHSRENRYAALEAAPNATQIRLSDGVYPFEAGALEDGVTVNYLTYENVSFDAGFKYKGFSFQGEYTIRKLSNFDALDSVTGAPVSLDDDAIVDGGFFVEAGHMIVKEKLMLYGVTSYFDDEFKRNPWELGGGANFYPYGSRSVRVNAHLLHVEQSPAGSTFGYYTAGQTGTIFSLGVDFLL